MFEIKLQDGSKYLLDTDYKRLPKKAYNCIGYYFEAVIGLDRGLIESISKGDKSTVKYFGITVNKKDVKEFNNA